MPILESHAVEINKPENHKLDVAKVNFNLNNKIENDDEEDMIKGKVAKKAEPIVKSRNKAVGLEDKFAHNTHSGSNQVTGIISLTTFKLLSILLNSISAFRFNSFSLI